MKLRKKIKRMSRPKRSWPCKLICSSLVVVCASLAPAQTASDASLNAVRTSDRADRTAKGGFAQVTPAEHMRRAGIYLANRAFAAAREHWQALVDNYPNDANVPAALYGIGRTLFQERRYEEALQIVERHVRIGAARQQPPERMAHFSQALHAQGLG